MLLVIIVHLLLACVVSHPPSLLVNPSLGCRTDELEALLSFKATFAVGGAPTGCERPYGKTQSWRNGSSRWDGVTCDPSSGHVMELDLSCSLLAGAFPSNTTLFRLRGLRRINLAYNNFSGSSIPSGFGRFSRLSYLNLSHSSFSGQVPPEIGWLSRLTTLDLSYSDVEMLDLKTIIANLSDLRELDLSQVGIYTNLPPTIANLSELETLRLSDCGLPGEFPAGSVLNMPKLRVLNVGGNLRMNGDFSNLTARWRSPLEVVDFNYCTFTGELPDSIGEPSNFSLRSFNIFDCGFHGRIPNWIWNVKEEIIISGNHFYGTMPPTTNTTALDRLSTIDASNNMIAGMIPTWLFLLPSLNSLQLYLNLFTGMSQSPDTNTTASSSVLTDFSARDNPLQGQIPQVVFELRSLQSLSLARTNLAGIVPLSKLHNLQSLNDLSLSGNNLSIIDDMGTNSTYSWPNLSNLDLSSCNLGHFPEFLRRQSLLSLKLSNCGIQGLVPQWFLLGASKLSLMFLWLSHNSLTGGLERLPWPNMLYIDLSFNMLQGVVPIPPLKTLLFLASHNQFVGDIPPLVCDSSNLLVLDLSHNNLNGSMPNCLANLTALDLRQNQLQGVIPSAMFQNCRSLTTLSLSGNLLQGSIPQTLSNCTRLELLDFGHNNLNGTFPNWLDILPNLQVLILGSNKLKGPLLSSNLTNPYPKLRILDISSNDITGGLPDGLLMSFKAMIGPDISVLRYMSLDYYQDSIKAWIKGYERELGEILDALVFIDASRNRIEGSIPEAIGDLVSLRSLNLAHNNFQGNIPPSLGNLSLLESLDLSFNRLDGRLPSELVNLNFLEFFNVSENNLEGEVPTSKQFGTFLDNSYLGNPRLCGELLTKKCGKKGELPNSRTSEGEPSSSGFHVWVIVLMGFGCGMFVGSVWGYFIFWETNFYQGEKLIFKMEVFIKRN